MSASIPTPGRLPFRVLVEPTPVSLARFGRAVFRTQAMVSSAHVGVRSTDPWTAVVWLRAPMVPMFESMCLPQGFNLLNSREALAGP